MSKKLILLLLIIPIIVMIFLFLATETLSNLVDVPVSGIEIVDTEDHIYLDLDKNETHTLNYVIYPTAAKNKAVKASYDAIDGKNVANLEFEVKDGSVTIIPKSAGSSKVTLTTVDGGYKDSVVVHVESTALKSINCTVPKSRLEVGESVIINTDFVPSAPSNPLLHYESSDPSVAVVNDKGLIKGVGRGTAEITVTSDYNPEIFNVLTIEVYNSGTLNVTGEDFVMNSNGEIALSVVKEEIDSFDKKNFKFEVYDKYNNLLDESVIKVVLNEVNAEKGNYSIAYEFVDQTYVGEFTVVVTYSDGHQIFDASFTTSKVEDMDIKFDYENEFSLYTGQANVQVNFTLIPSDAKVKYSVNASNDNITAKMLSSRLLIEGKKAGITTLTITATDTSDSNRVCSAEIVVVIKPKMSISEIANTYGIEDILTIGKFEYANGVLKNTSDTENKLAIHYTTSSEIGSGFHEHFNWVSNTPDVYIDKNGVISFANDEFVGIVEFEGVLSYGNTKESTGKMLIRCVGNGVNVYSYEHLYNATNAEKVVVLRNNIKDDFGKINGQVKYKTIHTTYDDTYYRNIGEYDDATVKILIEFKNDVYGNGHTINAHNIAYGLDSAGQLKSDAEFKGPLDFIRLNENNGSINVKGQDNICFAVYEGVTVNNIELYGCTLESEDGKIDLIDLAYTGTTVEIFGDNATIEYSRIFNGRTVLRAFGDINDKEKVINVNIRNSVLSGAREFIMRIGSNCFVDGEVTETVNNASPSLPGDSGSDYRTKVNYDKLTEEQKKNYDDKFIKTFVNVKNTVFKDAGLFAIGVDSHFSGTALANGPEVVKQLGSIGNLFKKPGGGTLIDDWIGLAKTSYGAKLKFEGEVELFCWKDLGRVDSSTLINVPQNSIFKGKIDFDVQSMITELTTDGGRYPEMTYTENGTTYVHAGIAFFGGGKNYGVFESKATSNYTLSRYEISLKDVNRDYFEYAAGKESFYFFIYNSNSGFGYKDQEVKLGPGGDGYNCIYKK